jgi:nitroreductase
MRPFRVDPRDVRAEEFPKEGTNRERLAFLLRYAILAPSVHNSQPWKFSIDRDRIGVFADRTRWLKAADPDRRDFHLSLGCALENLLVAARHFGYSPEVSHFPRPASPNLAALVNLPPATRAPAPTSGPLDLIARRHTSYRKYTAGLLTPGLLEALDGACAAGEATLFRETDPGIKHAVAELLRRAAAEQFADTAFRDEVGEWTGRGEYGIARPRFRFGRWGVQQVEEFMEHEVELFARAPLVGALLSRQDDPAAQLRTGQALERVWLVAERWGLSLRPASALCAVPAVRKELARVVGAGDSHVQHVFRLGFSEAEKARTGRRPVDEVIAAIPLT